MPVVVQTINVGTYAMDATGDPLQLGLIKVNQNFQALAGAVGGNPVLINTGTTNQMNGDDAPVFCATINTNFAYYFGIAGQPAYQEVINYTPPGQPIIGVADPGRVIFLKCNSMFAYLAQVL